MEERRAHPTQCLMQEEWGMIKEHVRGTEEYRKSLCSKLDDIRKENKERFDMLMANIVEEGKKRDDHMKTIDDRLYKHKAEFLVATEVVNSRVTGVKQEAGKIIFWGVVSLISFATMWGALTTVVATNTAKWTKLEPEHQVLMSDMEVVKNIHKGGSFESSVGVRKV